MGKKKYLIIIAAIIFIFLAIFAFANPLNKEEKVDENVIEEVEKDKEENKDKEEEIVEIKPVVEPTYNNHGVTIDKESTIEDKSFELASEVLQKAEITLSIEDLDKAIKLIEKVKNEDERKKLEERVDKVIETLDLTNLVNTLVENVNSATSKSDMNKARNFVEEKDLVNRIDDLSNEVVKKLLIDKLETINNLLKDTTDPTINIEDGAILDSDTKITVTDESEVTIVLNDEEIENNKVVSDGVYELTATDAAFNSVTITFTVENVENKDGVSLTISGITTEYETLEEALNKLKEKNAESAIITLFSSQEKKVVRG